MDVNARADLAHSHVLRQTRSFGKSLLSGSLLAYYIHIEKATDHVSDHPVPREPGKGSAYRGCGIILLSQAVLRLQY
jgi:hypothetical protein